MHEALLINFMQVNNKRYIHLLLCDSYVVKNENLTEF